MSTSPQTSTAPPPAPFALPAAPATVATAAQGRWRGPVLLVIAHLAALLFGVAGLLIALPNPQWWAGDPLAMHAFNFGMSYGGATHIIFGALAVFVLGMRLIGLRATAIFFVVSCALSLGSELLGTSTGFPFGNYAYTDFLGYKVLGHVPFTIPLSWFYMGLTAYLLGITIVSTLPVRRQTLWSLALGVWFLTAWDLVLDPAMAAPGLPVKFWEWHIDGPYFGMPLQNLIGWSVTGLLYMALSRALWGHQPAAVRDQTGVLLLYLVYAANLAFAMAISASAGLWPPLALAIVAGLIPALFAFRATRAAAPTPAGAGPAPLPAR